MRSFSFFYRQKLTFLFVKNIGSEFLEHRRIWEDQAPEDPDESGQTFSDRYKATSLYRNGDAKLNIPFHTEVSSNPILKAIQRAYENNKYENKKNVTPTDPDATLAYNARNSEGNTNNIPKERLKSAIEKRKKEAEEYGKEIETKNDEMLDMRTAGTAGGLDISSSVDRIEKFLSFYSSQSILPSSFTTPSSPSYLFDLLKIKKDDPKSFSVTDISKTQKYIDSLELHISNRDFSTSYNTSTPPSGIDGKALFQQDLENIRNFLNELEKLANIVQKKEDAEKYDFKKIPGTSVTSPKIIDLQDNEKQTKKNIQSAQLSLESLQAKLSLHNLQKTNAEKKLTDLVDTATGEGLEQKAQDALVSSASTPKAIDITNALTDYQTALDEFLTAEFQVKKAKLKVQNAQKDNEYINDFLRIGTSIVNNKPNNKIASDIDTPITGTQNEFEWFLKVAQQKIYKIFWKDGDTNTEPVIPMNSNPKIIQFLVERVLVDGEDSTTVFNEIQRDPSLIYNLSIVYATIRSKNTTNLDANNTLIDGQNPSDPFKKFLKREFGKEDIDPLKKATPDQLKKLKLKKEVAQEEQEVLNTAQKASFLRAYDALLAKEGENWKKQQQYSNFTAGNWLNNEGKLKPEVDTSVLANVIYNHPYKDFAFFKNPNSLTKEDLIKNAISGDSNALGIIREIQNYIIVQRKNELIGAEETQAMMMKKKNPTDFLAEIQDYAMENPEAAVAFGFLAFLMGGKKGFKWVGAGIALVTINNSIGNTRLLDGRTIGEAISDLTHDGTDLTDMRHTPEAGFINSRKGLIKYPNSFEACQLMKEIPLKDLLEWDTSVRSDPRDFPNRTNPGDEGKKVYFEKMPDSVRKQVQQLKSSRKFTDETEAAICIWKVWNEFLLKRGEKNKKVGNGEEETPEAGLEVIKAIYTNEEIPKEYEDYRTTLPNNLRQRYLKDERLTFGEVLHFEEWDTVDEAISNLSYTESFTQFLGENWKELMPIAKDGLKTLKKFTKKQIDDIKNIYGPDLWKIINDNGGKIIDFVADTVNGGIHSVQIFLAGHQMEIQALKDTGTWILKAPFMAGEKVFKVAKNNLPIVLGYVKSTASMVGASFEKLFGDTNEAKEQVNIGSATDLYDALDKIQLTKAIIEAYGLPNIQQDIGGKMRNVGLYQLCSEIFVKHQAQFIAGLQNPQNISTETIDKYKTGQIQWTNAGTTVPSRPIVFNTLTDIPRGVIGKYFFRDIWFLTTANKSMNTLANVYNFLPNGLKDVMSTESALVGVINLARNAIGKPSLPNSSTVPNASNSFLQNYAPFFDMATMKEVPNVTKAKTFFSDIEGIINGTTEPTPPATGTVADLVTDVSKSALLASGNTPNLAPGDFTNNAEITNFIWTKDRYNALVDSVANSGLGNEATKQAFLVFAKKEENVKLIFQKIAPFKYNTSSFNSAVPELIYGSDSSGQFVGLVSKETMEDILKTVKVEIKANMENKTVPTGTQTIPLGYTFLYTDPTDAHFFQQFASNYATTTHPHNAFIVQNK